MKHQEMKYRGNQKGRRRHKYHCTVIRRQKYGILINHADDIAAQRQGSQLWLYACERLGISALPCQFQLISWH